MVRVGNPQSRYVNVVDVKDILAHPKLWLAFGASTILVFQYKTYFLSQELRIYELQLECRPYIFLRSTPHLAISKFRLPC